MVATLFLFGGCTVNALSLIDKAARNGSLYETWRAFGEEYTSLAAILFALPVVVAAAIAFDSGDWRTKAVAVLLGIAGFSAIHISVMIALREGIWPIFGHGYEFGLSSETPFELRKDAITFAWMLGLLLVDLRWPRKAVANTAMPGASATVTLRDGNREVVVALDTLVAVEAQGNYIDLVRANGARHALRTTLRTAESRLAPFGFRRAHRRWLVAVESVTELSATGNGDWRLRVSDEVWLPMSRRQSETLSAVRRVVASIPLS